MSLGHGSRVVVLGGTSGIGLAVARAAAHRRAEVIIASRRPDAVRSALGQLPAGSVGGALDVSDNDELEAFLTELATFDHLVYTAAGSLRPTPMAEYSVGDAKLFFGLRVFHALNAVKLAVPRMRPGGSITLTSGTAAFKGGPGWSLGCSASGAIAAATRSLAAELAPLRVNAVAPGVVRSPLWSQVADDDRERMYTSVGQTVPLGRVGEVDDVALAYIALMEQDYVTGVVSVVDGGTLVA